MNRRIVKTIFALIVVSCFVYVGRGYLDQLPRILKASPIGILGIALVHVVTVWLQGLTLKHGLQPVGHSISGKETFAVSTVSAYSNLLVPRAGVGVAGAYLKSAKGVPISDYTMVTVFNGLVFVLVCSLATLIAFTAQWANLSQVPPGLVIITLLGMIFASAAAILIPWKMPHRYRGPGSRFLANLSNAKAELSNSKVVPQLVGLHVAMLLLRGVRLYIAFWAMGIEASFAAVMLVSFFSDLAFVISVTPGAMGFREAAITFLASMLGTSPAIALSIAVFDRLVFSMTVAIIAQWFLAKMMRHGTSTNDRSDEQRNQVTQKRPKVVFIATREPTYSRVSIVLGALQKNFDVLAMTSAKKNYPIRLVVLSLAVLKLWITGQFRKADVVVVGFFAQPIFPLVRLLTRKPIVSDAYFSIYDTLVFDKQKVAERSMTARFCKWLDRHMLRNSDLCFTDTETHADYMAKTFCADRTKIKRLWISAENQDLGLRPEFKNGEAFQVFFWGGFIPLQGVPTIVRAAQLLENDNIQFTIFGDGQTFDTSRNLANELGTANIHFAGWKSSNAIETQARRSHLALGIFGNTEKAGRVIPNKAFEAMAMGIPLVTRGSQAVDELLRHKHDAFLTAASDPAELADAIRWCRDHYAFTCEMSANASLTFQQVACPHEVARTIQSEIDWLLGKVRPDAGPDNDATHETELFVPKESTRKDRERVAT